MDDNDKQTYLEARPYIEGLVALGCCLRWGYTEQPSVVLSFSFAEVFLKEFERRNGIIRE